MRSVWMLTFILFTGGTTPVWTQSQVFELAAMDRGVLYVPTAATLAQRFNQGFTTSGRRISTRAICSSAITITLVTAGQSHLGAAHSKWIHQAVQGVGRWHGRPQSDLRTICNLHPIPIVLLTRDDADLRALDDLAGRRVYAGPAGCDLHQTVADILQAAGVRVQFERPAGPAPGDEGLHLLLDGAIDACFVIPGTLRRSFHDRLGQPHPPLRLVPLTSASLDAWLVGNSFYTPLTTATGDFPFVTNTAEVATIGVRSSLITTEGLPADVATVLAGAALAVVDDNGPRNARSISRGEITHRLAAPLHPAATDLFKKNGLSIRYTHIE